MKSSGASGVSQARLSLQARTRKNFAAAIPCSVARADTQRKTWNVHTAEGGVKGKRVRWGRRVSGEPGCVAAAVNGRPQSLEGDPKAAAV